MQRTLVLCALAALPAAAFADEIDSFGGKVVEIDARVHDLDSQLKPPAAPGPEIAERRLIDAQVLYELRNYEAASIILFDVVEKYPNSAAFPEALFYLADSLYLKRDFLSSRRFFEKIVESGPATLRYQEALQRLIELSLHTGDYSPVDGYIAKLDQTPPDKMLPSVPYVKGKYFFFRRQFDKALEALKALTPSHVYYFHGLYFMAAANVAMGEEHLPDALLAFGTILKTEAKTDSQKRITELAHLGLARVYLDRGQLTNALDEYARLSPKSELFNDALYESAWVSIKGKDFVKAARALDLLLLNAPQSPLVPEVKLLLGSLHIRREQYGPATEAFTKARDEYEPIRKSLEDELTKTGDAAVYFRGLIAQNLARFDTNAILPANAARWLKSEPEVVRVHTLVADQGDLKRSLDESDEVVRRLEKAMAGPGRINVFPELAQARTKAVELTNELTEIKQKLSTREAQLVSTVAGAEKGQLDQLSAERQALEAKLGTQPGRADAITQKQMRARQAYNDLDKRANELTTVLTGLKDSLNAVRKLHHDAVNKGQPLLPDRVYQAAATVPPSAASVPAAERQAELDGRLKDLKGQLEQAKTRTDALKEVGLKTPANAGPELEAVAPLLASLQSAIEQVRKEIEDAAISVGVDDADMQQQAQLKAQYDDLLKRQHEASVQVRSRLNGGDRTKAEQIESILERARGVESKVAQFNQRIEVLLDAKLKDIQAAVGEEKTHVSEFRGTLAGYGNESSDVGGGIVAETFRQVASRFYNIVVRSDVGIIDVAWALKDAATRESNRLTAERKRELKLLDDEFKEVLKEQP